MPTPLRMPFALTPRFLSCVMLILVGSTNVSQFARAAGEDAPQWIWSEQDRDRETSATFVKRFSLEEPTASATVRFLGESASVALSLNGKLLRRTEAYDPQQRMDLSDHLARGANTLRLDCRSTAGPSAFFLILEIEAASGQRKVIVSDRSWRVLKKSKSLAAVEFGAVDPRLLTQRKQRVGISAVDNYEQWKQALGAKGGADPASFLTAPGFEIKLVRSAKEGEDSWVSLAFDPQGRAVIGQEKQGLLRFQLNKTGDVVLAADRINDTLKECRGLLFANGSLYANANNSKALYRLRSRGDDFEKPELLYASTGGVGHGRNDLALGPDNKIYMIHGDSVHIPTDVRDFTSPFRDARRGKRTSEGHLLRIGLEGGPVEVVAAGLRNPFGIDFNADGEPFTYDADAEYDMGSPWYRPTRVSHLVLGGDYGWRGVTKTWPPYYPDHADNALPNLDIGKGSPTAVKFGSKTNFPRRYQQALYILDWAYGRIVAVHMTPRGGSYVMAAETFLKGRPLNVTDLDVAPNGSMYLVTGGRGTRSALYRIRYVGESTSTAKDPAATAQQRARAAFAKRATSQRRRLESLLVSPQPNSIQAAWPFLKNADPWLQHAARNVVEQQPVESWADKALREDDPTAACQALLCLARSGADNAGVIRRLNQLPWPIASRSNKLAILQCYWLCSKGKLDDSLTARAASKLGAAFPDNSTRVNRLLSQVLVRFQAREAYAKIVKRLVSANAQREKMHYLFVLRHELNALSGEDRNRYFERLAETRDYLGGAGIPDFLRRIRQESLASLDAAERDRYSQELSAQAKQISTPTPRDFVKKWSVGELQDKLAAVGKNRDLKRGAQLFVDAACVKCHRAGGKGAAIGPDLTSVSRRFSRVDLLTSIVEPSKVVAEKYRSLQVITSDGKSLVGQVAIGGDYRSPILRLATNPLRPDEIVEIPKNNIESQRASTVSWMPQGLLDTLSEDEIWDLLAYLESLAIAAD